MRALITGVAGFAGSHLADVLFTQPDWDVWGVALVGENPAYLHPAVHLLHADLRDPDAVRSIIRKARPDRVYHLAGQAFVPQSHLDPWETLETNLRPQLNLFESLLAEDLRPRILVVGSYEVYDKHAARAGSVNEDWPLGPDSPYGVSKVAQDFLARQYFETHGLPIVRARPFNHFGPRQSTRFVASAFASQVARILAGEQEPVMRVGNLSARRDFTDVRDIVRGYAQLLERGEAGEAYNLGAGRSVEIQELLDRLLAVAGCACEVIVAPELYRPVTSPDLTCDYSAARAATGWEPLIPLEQTLADLLAYEQSRIEQLTVWGRPSVAAPSAA